MPRINVMNFKNDFDLNKILSLIENGHIGLPYFQRDFVWSTYEMRALIASMLLGLPIGSILIFESDSNDFATRKIEGSDLAKNATKFYLLDGQQRATSLFSIFTVVKNSTKSKLTQRWFIDMRLFINLEVKENDSLAFSMTSKEPEEIANQFIMPVSTSKKDLFADQKGDEEEFIKSCIKKNYYPLDYLYNTNESNKIYNAKSILDGIRRNFTTEIQSKNPKIKAEELEKKISVWQDEVRDYLTSLLTITIPAMVFKTNEFNRAIQAFEILNKSGKQLHIFDLLVARAGRSVQTKNETIENFHSSVIKTLTKNIPKIELKNLNNQFNLDFWDISLLREKENIITNKIKDMIVNVLTVLISPFSTILLKKDYLKTNDKSILESIKKNIAKTLKDKKILLDESPITISNTYLFELPVKESSILLNNFIELCVERLIRALCFLQCRCGLQKVTDIAYKLIIIPLAFWLDDSNWKNTTKLNHIEAWYWQTILSGEYEYNQSVVTIKQLLRLGIILKKPTEMTEVDITNTLDKVRTNAQGDDNSINYTALKGYGPTNSIYKTLMQYVISRNPSDFLCEENKDKPDHLLAWDISNNFEDHHIMPLNSIKKIKESTTSIRQSNTPLNSILNRTIISKKSNRIIGGMDYEKYKTEIKDFVLREHFVKDYSFPDKIEDDKKADEEHEKFLSHRYNSLKAGIQDEIRNLLN